MNSAPHFNEQQIDELCDMATVTDWLEQAWGDLGEGNADTTVRVRANAGETIRAIAENEWNTGESLDIVDDRRTLEETRNGRERWFKFGKTFAAFEGSQQSRFFATDVRACTTMDLARSPMMARPTFIRIY